MIRRGALFFLGYTATWFFAGVAIGVARFALQ